LTSNTPAPEEMVTQFVLECKGKGNFLPYVDYELISSWLKSVSSVDELLLILSDILPKYFGDEGSKKQLSGVDKLVRASIKDRAMRRP
jgi:hypothetical protein